ncbi:MAG TPA: hypothetical protein VHY35_13755 [Stellaceae bacterium]|jgi:hypothetical protein|nr:hypothetical protein [Stellaceae bacterium]
MAELTPPDFVERQFIGEPNGAGNLIRQLADRMYERGATWLRATILRKKDQVVMEGWCVRPNCQGPEPT